jgi:hypothetical protein
MLRAIGSTLIAALAFVALAVPAAAGGWAVTTFDQLPPDFHAGQPYALGYTIRQHGKTPIRVESTLIRITGDHGTATFPGAADGPVGHYVATVTFPAAGAYTWQVTQDPFAAQDLGTVSVLAAAAPVTAPGTGASAPATDPIRALLPYAAAAAALMFAWRLLTLVRLARRRSVAT